MSVAATVWAWKQQTGQAAKKLILLALADFTNKEGVSYPGQATIARMTEMSTRSVRTHLEDLEAVGLIMRTSRYRADGTRDSDAYQLMALPEEIAGSNSDYRKVTTPTTGKLCLNPAEKVSADPILRDPFKRSILTDDQEKAFTAFWKLYPKKVGKRDAIALWKKIDAVLYSVIMARLETAVRVDWQDRPLDKIKNPSTWLFGAHWEDAVIQPTPKSNGNVRAAEPDYPGWDAEEFERKHVINSPLYQGKR